MASNSEELLEQWESTTDEFRGLTGDELIEKWDALSEARDEIVGELQRRNLYPSTAANKWEMETGAYPSQDDPEFLQKLLAKREFAESLQTSWEPKYDACGQVEQFEVTPVQRFVSNLMSPKSPYMSALLYHGVGVGKTCSAIQIAEAWLEAYPGQRVIIITPPTIREGFERTIFDMQRLKIGTSEGAPNTQVGCTGNRYLELTGTTFERDTSKIAYKIKREINRRYNIMGYMSFANYIKNILKKIRGSEKDEEELKTAKAQLFNKTFSGSLIIVDEAHNLRDLPEEVADTEVDAPGGKAEKADAAAGKILTPFLTDVVKYTEGLKLVLMTATPMYDNYREIIFLLNLLLANDKKALLSESKVFQKDGTLKPEGEKLLAAATMRYVSFMRGENPRSFPIRLEPQGIKQLTLDTYPSQNPRGGPVPESELLFLDYLPIVPIKLRDDALSVSEQFMQALPAGSGGLSSISMTQIVQAGNFVIPGDDETPYTSRVGEAGINTAFTEEKVDREKRYKAIDPTWLALDKIGAYSPKFEFLLKRLATSEGVAFVYTRFVKGCALPLALVLEANGYLPYGRKKGLLVNGIQSPGGRQCAVCPKREKQHTADEMAHFKPAYYGLLTGDVELSPHNEDIIRGERAMDNVDGYKMKVIIGSQIASEGVDLRFVRESHILDSWYHLSKTEQIIGRSIRFCSHSALPSEKRNTTVYLYAARYPSDIGRETADLYSYRIAFRKARQVGRITRILKQHAIDCNLNHDAIIIKDQKAVKQEDSQRVVRPSVQINDMPYTAICDWTEDCDYSCKPTIKIDVGEADDSTYDEFSAAWLMSKLKAQLRERFAEQVQFSAEKMSEMIEAPTAIRNALLLETVNNKSFQVEHGGKKGYIRYCNGYYIFQPNIYLDLSIPMSVRAAKFPVKRDIFAPIDVPVEDVLVAEEGEEETEASVDDVAAFWEAIVEWVDEMAATTKAIPIPIEFLTKISRLAGEDKAVEKRISQIVAIVRWFQIAYHSSAPAAGGAGVSRDTTVFKRTLLEFFWDNWLTLAEQKALSDDPHAADRENIYNLGGMNVHRFLNAESKKPEFLCKGEPCSKAVADTVGRAKDDRLANRIVSDETTADVVIAPNEKGKPTVQQLVYGFMVPKKGAIVFKTNNAPGEGEKVGRGAECSIVSNTTSHMMKLIHLGLYMASKGLSDMNLREAKFYESRKDDIYGTLEVKNATRICALMELVLRYMEVQRVGGRHWFYRPVAAYYSGHRGT